MAGETALLMHNFRRENGKKSGNIVMVENNLSY
jgi:hypothetical protein